MGKQELVKLLFALEYDGPLNIVELLLPLREIMQLYVGPGKFMVWQGISKHLGLFMAI
jgi:hypothetical protein